MTRVTQFEHAGFTFDVIDAGPVDGEIVILLHGFPQRASSWHHVAERLHAQGFRTLAPDQRGYSPRARPRSRVDYRIPQLRGDIEALIASLGGQPVHVVGHDWGAVVAWSLAAERPELVRSLTAISVPHLMAFLRSMFTSSQAAKSWYMGFFQLPLVPELLSRFVPRFFRRTLAQMGMTEDNLATFERDIVQYGALSGGLGWYRALPLNPMWQARTKVTVPTTFVWSNGDAALGRKGAELTQKYVTGPYKFVELDGSHWLPEQQPQVVANEVIGRCVS